jgi:hypothetical protein
MVKINKLTKIIKKLLTIDKLNSRLLLNPQENHPKWRRRTTAMDNTKSTPLQRIQKVSWRVRFVYIFLIAVVLITVVMGLMVFFAENGGFLVKNDWLDYRFIFFSDGSEFSETNGTFVHFKDLSAMARILYLLGVAPFFFCTLKGLFHLQKLFYYYAQGKIFSPKANGQIRKCGWTICIYGVLHDVGLQLVKNSIFLALNRGFWGVRNQGPEFPLNFIFILIVGAIIICVSWAMETGREMLEDQELTI